MWKKLDSENFVQWFMSRMENNLSLTFGDVSKKFECSFEYMEEDVFLHFKDGSKVVFQMHEDKYYPIEV